MNQDDIAKNGVAKVYIKIPIPAVNEYPIKDIKHWMKNVYHQARLKLSRRKADKFKEMMPIETAAYAERKVFGNWRLVAPSRGPVCRATCLRANLPTAPAGQAGTHRQNGTGRGDASPLQQVITAIRDEIVPTRWGEFRRDFVREIKLDFNAICDADYDQKMVDEVNGRLNDLLNEYSRSKDGVKINFVLKPETAVGYSSPELLAIRSSIWERFTGQGLDPAQYQNPFAVGRQMAMDLRASNKMKPRINTNN